MSRFLVGTIPVVGHVTPAVAIVSRLIERGHQVWWYTGKLFQPLVESTGAKFVPMVQALDYSVAENVPSNWVEQRAALRGLAQLKFDLKHFFVDAAVGHVKDYTELLQAFPADVLLSDSFFLGAAWVQEQTNLPWAQFGISVLAFSSCDVAPFGLALPPDDSWLGRWRNRSLNWFSQQVVFGDLLTYTNQIRTSLGLSAGDSFFDTVSPFLYLAGTVSAFEYPRSDLPEQVHFVGNLLSDTSSRALAEISSQFVLPDWWSDLQSGLPVVHVTQGTVATAADDLIFPTLEALAEEPVLVVATTGKAVETMPDHIPANARIATFIPYAELLPHVDVMVTNGGYNGVQMALAHGIPLVTAGQTEDKPEVCARLAWTRAGINLKTQKPTSRQIREAVQKLLSQPQYKAKAQALQQMIRACDAPQRAVELLEQLAETKQPVYRTNANS